MATVPPEAQPPALKEDEPFLPDGADKADMLYDKCAQAPQGTVFFQRELSNMAVAANMAELAMLLQELVGKHLMKLMTFENEPCWKLRERAEAEKLRRLTPDERLLYHHIDQAQTEGIWSKALRARTNFIQQHVTKCLKSLENKDLIQSVMSVKHPNRKMYLLKHLRPSEDMAGGPWQSEGEFDLPLIEAISKIIEQIIQRDTCVMVPPGYNNYQNIDRAEAIAQKKAQVQGVRDIEEALPVRSVRPQVARLVTLHNPKYPTASSLRENIMASGIIKEKEIKDADMEQLLEMMVLEGRLEKVGRTNYRLALRATETEGLNGFVDAPCGTCPVFDLCGDSGEITARTCVYFGEWLATDSEPVR